MTEWRGEERMKHVSGEILIKNGHTIASATHNAKSTQGKILGRRLCARSVLLPTVGAPDGG